MARLIAVLAAFGVLAAAASGASADAWDPGTLPAGTVRFWPETAFTGPGEVTSLYQVGSSVQALVRTLGPAGTTSIQTLQDSDAYLAALAGSTAAGAVGAWYDQSDHSVRVIEKPPLGPIRTTLHLDSLGANDSEQRPQIAVDDLGHAVIGYLVDHDGQQAAAIVVRGVNGTWSEPQLLAPEVQDRQVIRSVAISEDGEVVVGWIDGGQPYVSIRTAEGVVLPAQELAGSFGADPTDDWYLPKVGVDAAGGAVVLSGHSDGSWVYPLEVAFRAPGAPAFGPPAPVGAGVYVMDDPQLAVSAAGEVALATETAAPETGGAGLLGLHAAFGSTTTEQLGPLVDIGPWEEDEASLGMNRRGDAVLAVDGFDDASDRVLARRRLPFAPWGAEADALAPVPLPTYGRTPTSAGVDALGNAMFDWGNPDVDGIATSTPLNLVSLPSVTPPAGFTISDVLPPLPVPTTGGSGSGATPTVPGLGGIALVPAPATPATRTAGAGARPALPVLALTGPTLDRAATHVTLLAWCRARCTVRLRGTLIDAAHHRVALRSAAFSLRRPGAHAVSFALTKATSARLRSAERHHTTRRWLGAFQASSPPASTISFQRPL